jgi:DNA polymerase-3 subunit gamma/tau
VSELLALKYRPAVFSDMSGQRPSVALLYRMCKLGNVPSGLLLHGQFGSGKTTMARIVAKALNCEAGPGKASEWPCLTCASCLAVDNGTSPDVEELDAASNGGIDQIREVRSRAHFGTAGGRYRVFIIDEAHGVSGPGFDAILKTLEEAPPGVVFILVTTQPRSIPPTIHSRCSPFQFDPLPAGVIRARLQFICDAEGFKMEDALLTALAEAADGSMRDAVMQLDQVASVGVGSLDMWLQLNGKTDFAPVLLAAAADGDFAAMRTAMTGALSSCGDAGQVTRELVRCLADLQVLSCGADIGLHGGALEVRQDLIARLGPVRVHAAMAVLWDLQVKVKAEDRETSLALALSMVSRRLCPPPAPIAPPGDVFASPDDIRSILERA